MVIKRFRRGRIIGGEREQVTHLAARHVHHAEVPPGGDQHSPSLASGNPDIRDHAVTVPATEPADSPPSWSARPRRRRQARCALAEAPPFVRDENLESSERKVAPLPAPQPFAPRPPA